MLEMSHECGFDMHDACPILLDDDSLCVCDCHGGAEVPAVVPVPSGAPGFKLDLASV